MSDAVARFSGSMPDYYERYMVPMLFAPHARIAAARLGDMRSGRVLELAAGTGAMTRASAAVLPDAVAIVATDLNQPMLDRATPHTGSARVRWQQADALALPFGDREFDAVVCQFGVMFYPDKPAGFAETFRVLKPGGRFIFSVWDVMERNVLNQICYDTVSALFPADPPRGFLGPFSHLDPATIASDLAGVGFEAVDIETMSEKSRAASARDAALGPCKGSSTGNESDARSPGCLDRATDAVAAAIAARFGTGPIEAPNQALLVRARRPAV